jgi:glycosyltransferase involved in cell wall biosynthesis
MMTMELPFPPVGGGRLRSHQFIEALVGRHDLTIVGFTFDEIPICSTLPIQIVPVAWGWPKLYQQMHSDDVGVSQEAYNSLAYEIDDPWVVSFYHSSTMAETLKRVTETNFDLILIKDTIIAQYVSVLPPDVPKIIDFQDVLTRMAQRDVDAAGANEKPGAIREAARMLAFEKFVASQCALSLTCSSVEAAAVRQSLGVQSVAVVPNEVNTTFFTPSQDPTIPGYLLFTGTMDYGPNVEAVRYFAREIYPLILEDVEGAKFHIVGKNPAEGVLSLASKDVVVHGGVPDVRPYYRDADIVVVPLLQGGGTRRKILEAAASGKAIVTTSLGVEGLDFSPGQDLLIADSVSDFANAVVTLATDESKRLALGKRASEAALRYDVQQIASKICEHVESFSVRR